MCHHLRTRSGAQTGTRIAVLALGWLLFPSSALAAPRITLKLENVTLVEAARALQRTANRVFLVEGVLVFPGPRAENEPARPEVKVDAKARRADFNWSHAPLGRVCRDLEAAFGYSGLWYGTFAVNLVQGHPKPPASPWKVERSGFMLAATRVERQTSTETRAVLVLGRPRPEISREESGFLTLTLTVRAPDGDPDVVCGLDILRIATDRGPVPVVRQRYPSYAIGPEPSRTDECQVAIGLNEVPPGARKVLQLEGELIVRRRVEWVPLELPLSGAAVPLQRQLGFAKLLVKRLEMTTDGELTVEYRATWPADDPLGALEVDSLSMPIWHLRSGEVAEIGGNTCTIGSSDAGGMSERLVVFHGRALPPEDPVVALLLDFIVREGPVERIPFRLENIPLLGAPGRVRAPLAPPVPPGDRPGPGGAEPARRRPTTGTLVSPVLLRDARAAKGELALGLSRKMASGEWGPIWWKYIPTDDRGLARLDELAPGTYRVRRSFQARDAGGAALPAAERWVNGVVTARVRAGQTVTLPPLRRAR
jgi:hypothetical protein